MSYEIALSIVVGDDKKCLPLNDTDRLFVSNVLKSLHEENAQLKTQIVANVNLDQLPNTTPIVQQALAPIQFTQAVNNLLDPFGEQISNAANKLIARMLTAGAPRQIREPDIFDESDYASDDEIANKQEPTKLRLQWERKDLTTRLGRRWVSLYISVDRLLLVFDNGTNQIFYGELRDEKLLEVVDIVINYLDPAAN